MYIAKTWFMSNPCLIFNFTGCLSVISAPLNARFSASLFPVTFSDLWSSFAEIFIELVVVTVFAVVGVAEIAGHFRNEHIEKKIGTLGSFILKLKRDRFEMLFILATFFYKFTLNYRLSKFTSQLLSCQGNNCTSIGDICIPTLIIYGGWDIVEFNSNLLSQLCFQRRCRSLVRCTFI